MQTLRTTQTRLARLKALQLKRRCDWPAAFSINGYREIWPFQAWGRHGQEKRENIRGHSKLLDAIADRYLALRPEGGRLFVDDRKAYRPIGNQKIAFLKFQFIKKLKRQPH